jgi:hypothetical protein
LKNPQPNPSKSTIHPPKKNISTTIQPFRIDIPNQQWQMAQGAYNMIPSTRPQTIAAGLNDSPAGLAAWFIEKFQTWNDSDGDLEKSFTKDELITFFNVQR